LANALKRAHGRCTYSYVKTRRFLSDHKTMMKSNFKKSVMTSFQ